MAVEAGTASVFMGGKQNLKKQGEEINEALSDWKSGISCCLSQIDTGCFLTGVARAGITQLGHGHSQPWCASGISSFPALFPQNTEECHTALAQQPWSCSKLWLGSPLWPLTLPKLPSPHGHSKLLLPALSPDTDPSEVAQAWIQVLRVCQAREALPCAASLLPSSQGQCPVGTSQTVLKATGSPSLPLPNGNLPAQAHLQQAGNLLVCFYTQTWSHQTLLLAARKSLPLTVLLLRTAFLG